MIYVFVGFIVIFILFISLIMKYGQAFKVKNNIISFIEEYENMSIDAIEEINSHVDFGTTYRVSIPNEFKNSEYKCSSEYGYCYKYHSKSNSETLGHSEGYYTVYTFINWEFPFFGLHDTWVIKGETRPVAIGS